MAINKNDYVARRHWDEAYDAIPKSVFALVAWHLADLCSEDGVNNGQAESRFAEEVEALCHNGMIAPEQAKRVRAAIAKTKGGAS